MNDSLIFTLVLGLGLLTVTLLILVLALSKKLSDNRKALLRERISNSSDQSEMERIVRNFLGQGKSQTDYLTIFFRFAYGGASMQSAPNAILYVLRDFLKMLEEEHKIEPIVQLNKRVEFNSEQYVAYGPIKAASSAFTVEPGWRWKGNILRRPGVQKEKAG